MHALLFCHTYTYIIDLLTHTFLSFPFRDFRNTILTVTVTLTMTTRPSCAPAGGRLDTPKISNNNSNRNNSNRNSNNNNRNNNSNRRHGRPNLQRATQLLPGAFFFPVPPSLNQGSYNNEKRGNRNHANCINDALVVLRSTKRRKHYGKEEEEEQQQHQQQQQHQDDSRPQNSSNDGIDKSRPIHLNETTNISYNNNNNKTNKSILFPSTTTIATHNDFGVLPHRPTRTNGWEWTIGILPPAPSENQQQYQHQQYHQDQQQHHQQYTTTTTTTRPMPCSQQAEYNSTNLSFLSSLTPN
jgi:hypothetical protein